MHNNWEELIPYYVAGTLSRPETTRLENHLSRCAECRRSVDEWRAIAGVVRGEASAQMRGLPPLATQVLQYAGQQAAARQAQFYAQPVRASAARPRYSPTSITLLAAVFTVVLFGGLLAMIVLRGIQQPDTANVVLLATETPTLVISATQTALPTTPSTPSMRPEIIVIEPSATPDLPTPSPEMILPSATPVRIQPTRIPPTAILPPTIALPTQAPPTAQETFEAQLFIAPIAQKQGCTVRAAIPGVVNVYAASSTDYAVVSTFSGDDELTVLAMTDNGWYRVQYPVGGDAGTGWVQQAQVVASGTCDSIPLIPVAATATITPTPSETVLPFPSLSPTPSPTATETPQ